MRDAFTATGKATMFNVESGGSTRTSLAAARPDEPLANKSRTLDAKVATQTERKLCNCGFISRISFLNFCNCDDVGSSVTLTK